MKVNIELPFFPGFYESDLENSDTSYWAIKEELEYYQNEYCCEWGPGDESDKDFYSQLTEDDLDFHYKDYEKDVREAWVESFRRRVPEFVLSVGDVEMTSPRQYNFETDRLWADVELSEDWQDKVRAFMDENKDWLRDRIKNDWTSYDGFDSYMSNNFDDLSNDEDEEYWGKDRSWYWHLFSGQSRKWACYISTIIGYMMYRENNRLRDDLVMDALEDIYAGSYVFITDAGKERLEELKAQRELDIEEGRFVLPDPAQLELPLEY